MTKKQVEEERTAALPAEGGREREGSASSDVAQPPCLASSLDLLEIQRVIADLGSDWAFVLRIEADGSWKREWIGGALMTRPDLRVSDFEPAAWSRFIAVEDRTRASDHFAQAVREGWSRAEYRIRLPDTPVRWIESSIRAVQESVSSGSIRVYGSIRDITGRRMAEQALRQSESQYRALVEQASDGILVFDRAGRILASNPAAYELFGLDREALHARLLFDLIHPDDLDRDPLSLRNLASGMTLRSVRRVMGAEDWVWAELSARRLQDGRIQATIRDITARMEAERRIRNLAYFDSLTGLPNRDFFREQLEQALDRCRRGDKQLALIFLDIDRFKQVNDSLGHSSGDLLLQEVAERLRTVLRGSDSVARTVANPESSRDRSGPISRLGGDEFTILIPGLEHPQDAARVARRVLHALARPYSISGQEIFAGSSIGIAVWPDDGETSELLLRSADTAMYHAKSRGGNVYEFFNASMNVTSTRRLNLETRLRRALEKDEFKLTYQPIRDSQTGRVTAAEALLRWVDSEGGVVGPDEFIPIAEETGQIVEIGRWVLLTACEQGRKWREAGFEPIRLSVNISVCQLRIRGIAETVDQILFECGLEAGDLELEITESSILDENPNIIAAVGELSEMGVGFALDDFGTGYSSLSALQRFPIERLKIDRSFVAGVGENRSDEALTSAIVALAKRLDLKVVAEGVETEEQARFLQDLGCDELQGYLFSRPVDPEDFERFLVRREKPAAGDESSE